jgi:hypothetical protein
VSELKKNISTSLTKLDEALDGFTELVNSINDDPSALIKGKQKPEILKGME